ncbi:hypothetical protein MJ588_02135 [Klebsiella pneumoniae]|nr:hypothetical protein MJ588_02135 [Klebsiella pneumoniae]
MLDRGADHVAVGMILACLVQWEVLKGKKCWMHLRPADSAVAAVPSFISILIFKVLTVQPELC